MYDRLTVSRVVSKLAVKLRGVVITPSGTDKYAAVVIYDGESEDDDIVLSVRTGLGETNSVDFNPPLKLERGLYVSISGDCECVLVMYEY